VGAQFKDSITVDMTKDSSAFDYWSLYHNMLPTVGLVAIMLSF